MNDIISVTVTHLTTAVDASLLQFALTGPRCSATRACECRSMITATGNPSTVVWEEKFVGLVVRTLRSDCWQPVRKHPIQVAFVPACPPFSARRKTTLYSGYIEKTRTTADIGAKGLQQARANLTGTGRERGQWVND